MTTFNNTLRNGSVALMALVLLALPVSFVQASDIPERDFFYPESVDLFSAPSWDGGGNDTIFPESIDSYSSPEYFGGDTIYPESIDSYSSPSYGSGSSYGGSSSGSGFSMPSFGGSSANQAYRMSQGYPVFAPQKQTPANTTVTTNTCVNNSCNYVDNSVVDNSIKVSNSFNNQKKEDYRNDCYGQSGNSYNQGYGYNQQGTGYNQYDYNYGQGYDQGYNSSDCYVAPIAYNTTPYITLSQAPYTGLDLGPVGTVLYWTFLVLWCLGAAYLVVVKRIQNKVVSYLNGFLFGAASAPVAHSAHAPARAHSVAAPAPAADGIDPFIASQINKRA